MTLDSTDQAILDMLARDGRRPNTEIAATLGVSESTVRARVQPGVPPRVVFDPV